MINVEYNNMFLHIKFFQIYNKTNIYIHWNILLLKTTFVLVLRSVYITSYLLNLMLKTIDYNAFCSFNNSNKLSQKGRICFIGKFEMSEYKMKKYIYKEKIFQK